MGETWILCDTESVAIHLTGEDTVTLSWKDFVEDIMAEWQSFKKNSKAAGNEDRKSQITIHPHEGEYEPGKPNSVPPEHYVNFNLAEGEYLVQCPYDVSHRILSHRMGRHIFRCRSNYRDQLKKEGREFIQAHCPWTTKHTVPQMELQYHSAQCEYRGKTQDEMEAYKRYCPKKPEGYDKLEELASEEWSDEISGPEVNGTYDPKMKLESWPIIYNGTAGRNKTKKREFRDKQRLHFFHIVTKEGFFKSYKSGVHGTDTDTTPQDTSLLRGSTSLASTLEKLPEENPKAHLEDYDDDQSPIAEFVQNPFQLERISLDQQQQQQKTKPATTKLGNQAGPGPSKSPR